MPKNNESRRHQRGRNDAIHMSTQLTALLTLPQCYIPLPYKLHLPSPMHSHTTTIAFAYHVRLVHISPCSDEQSKTALVTLLTNIHGGCPAILPNQVSEEIPQAIHKYIHSYTDAHTHIHTHTHTHTHIHKCKI